MPCCRPSGGVGRVGGTGPARQQPSGPPWSLLCAWLCVPSAGASGPSPAARCWHLCSGPVVSAQVSEDMQGDCAPGEHVDVVDLVVLDGDGMAACTFRPRGRAEQGRSPRHPVQAWQNVWATSSFQDPEVALSPTWRSTSACCPSDTGLLLT